MDASRPVSAELLREHAEWLRRLAASLARDAHLAEDLSQEAWVAAIERPPAGRVDLGAWLATVIVNRLRQWRRGDARRVHRERSVAERSPVETPAELACRALAAREIAAAVAGLDEPFRTAIVLRYYDDLPPRAIAERLGIPLATVSSRLRRGLERLRVRLDVRCGRQDWLAALVAWPHRPVPMSNSLVSLLLAMISKLQIVLGAAACLGLLWCLVRLSAPTGAPPVRTRGDVQDAPTAAIVAEAPPSPEAGVNRREALPDARMEQPGPSVSEEHVVRGRVVDSDGRAASAVRILLITPAMRPLAVPERVGAATSGANGRFEMRAPRARGLLRADGPRIVTVMAGFVDPEAALEPIVVVATAAPLSGEVIDEAGRPIDGARLVLAVPESFAARLPFVLDASRVLRCTAVSDELGRFEMPDAFAVGGATLTAEHPGYRSRSESFSDVGRAWMRIVLGSDPAPGCVLCGEVLSFDGTPIAGARVAFGPCNTVADERGLFRFDDIGETRSARLIAVHPGHLPAALEVDLGERQDASAPPRFLRLVLGGPPLAITGRVVDDEGTPCPRARVWVADPTGFGRVGEELAHVESLIAGADSKDEIEVQFTGPDGLDVDGFLAALRERPTRCWSWVVADDAGRFTLPALLDRSYRLAAMDLETLLHAEAGFVPAGSEDVELVLPVRSGLRRLVGMVRTSAGAPVAAAEVEIIHRAFQVPSPEGRTVSWDVTGSSTHTDERGHFALDRVPRNEIRLVVRGPKIRSQSFPIDDDRGRELELVVEALEDAPALHLRIELADPALADSFACLDAQGEELPLLRTRVTERTSRLRWELHEGTSEAVGVDARAAWVVLFRDGAEVSRHAVTLVAGGLSVLRF